MGSKSARSSVLPESRRPADIEKITRSYSTEIGRGAYGIVYKGTDKDGKDIAVKVLQERTGSIDAAHVGSRKQQGAAPSNHTDSTEESQLRKY